MVNPIPYQPAGPVSPPWASPPGPEHLQQLALARERGRKIRRAFLTASISAWTLGVFAVLTFLVGLLSMSAVGTGLGMGMCIVTWFEFQGAFGLKRLDPDAPQRLAINQVVLGAMLFAYGAYSLFTIGDPTASIKAQIGSSPELDGYMSEISQMATIIYVIVYITVMAVAVLGPGLTAVYYYTRRKYIEQYVKETPSWILELQRAGLSI